MLTVDISNGSGDSRFCSCGCGQTFIPIVRGGNVKKFATAACKGRVETAIRRWGMKAFEAGEIDLEILRPYLNHHSQPG